MKRLYVPMALLGIWALSGCHSPVQQSVDALLCDRAGQPIDLGPPAALPPAATPPTSPLGQAAAPLLGDGGGEIQLVSAQKGQGKPATTLEKRLLEAGKDVPGATVPPIRLPPLDEKTQLDAAVKKYFPPLAEAGKEFQPPPGPDGRPLTLADLQKMAVANSPQLRQAAAAIERDKGAVVLAGQYPNPSIGPGASSSPGPSGGPLYGVILGQTIMGFGKLKAAEAAAVANLEQTKLAYRRAETDLMAAVRTGYFAVLVAQENVRANRALVDLTDEVYKVMVAQLKGGEVATYEPMQMGVFAIQARAGLITARNSYTLAWKQLASSMGLPGMPPTQLEGRIDMPLPLYHYDSVLAQVLTNHTDVGIANLGVAVARYNLRLAELQPYPDYTVSANIIHDNTPTLATGLSSFGGSALHWRVITSGVQVTFPIPVWNQGRGGIWQAQGALMQAVEEPHRVRNELSARVADAFRRYNENRSLVELYVKEALPKQVQAFRAAVKRHYGAEPDKVAYNDLISSEQNLVSVVGSYLTLLSLQWQAVVDVSSLLQTDDLFAGTERLPVASVADLHELLKLPCCHPCSTPQAQSLRGAQLVWPEAGLVPEPEKKPLPPPQTMQAPQAPPQIKQPPQAPPPAEKPGPDQLSFPRYTVPSQLRPVVLSAPPSLMQQPPPVATPAALRD